MKENPILEYLKLLKKHGRLDEKARYAALDALTEPDNRELQKEYFEEWDPLIAELSLNGKPFSCPDNSINGEFRFLLSENSIVAGINRTDLHSIIVGQPGTGKTTMVNFLIAPQAMMKGVKCWFFVKARDTEKLIKFMDNIVTVDFDNQIRINPLTPPSNFSRYAWQAYLWDIFVQAHAIYDGTKNFLLEQSYDLAGQYEKIRIEPSFFELHDFIKKKDFSKWSREARYQESALNRLGGMLKTSLRETFDCSKGYLNDLVNKSVIFNIKGLPSEQQVFIVNVLIAWLFCHKEYNRTDTTHFVIIDDAMLVFDISFENRPDRGTPVINHLLAEIRKPRIRILAMGQIPTMMGKGIYGTSFLKVMLSLANAKDVDYMLNIMGVHEKEQREYAHKLNKEEREALTKYSGRYLEPFLGHIPDISIMKKLDLINISKAEKRENNNKQMQEFSGIHPRQPYYEVIKVQDETEKQEKTDSSKEILLDIYNRFDVASRQRASDLGLNAETSDRIYKYIETEQFAEAIFLNLTGKQGGLAKFHLPTDKGLNIINKPAVKQGSGGKGAKHIFLQRYLKKHLSARGYKELEIEKEFCGKKIDLFCDYEGIKIGIEICISTFNTEYLNVIKDMDKCNIIFLICTDKKSKQKLEKKLKERMDCEALEDKVKVLRASELLMRDFEDL